MRRGRGGLARNKLPRMEGHDRGVDAERGVMEGERGGGCAGG